MQSMLSCILCSLWFAVMRFGGLEMAYLIYNRSNVCCFYIAAVLSVGKCVACECAKYIYALCGGAMA